MSARLGAESPSAIRSPQSPLERVPDRQPHRRVAVGLALVGVSTNRKETLRPDARSDEELSGAPQQPAIAEVEAYRESVELLLDARAVDTVVVGHPGVPERDARR